jgi:hypothetical protein
MKIWIQNRNMITEQPRCIWITSDGKVESNNRRVPVLGAYKDEARARQVLAEIFEFQRNGKCNYIMPQE